MSNSGTAVGALAGGPVYNAQKIDNNNTNEIAQQLFPSSGTKLVCTKCGREDFHFLILRRRRGLIEGLCKQNDGSGCYPLSARSNCQYTYPNQMDCPQLAEWEIYYGADMLTRRVCCADHVGNMLGKDQNHKIFPLED